MGEVVGSRKCCHVQKYWRWVTPHRSVRNPLSFIVCKLSADPACIPQPSVFWQKELLLLLLLNTRRKDIRDDSLPIRVARGNQISASAHRDQ
jgi:hypothetical protein